MKIPRVPVVYLLRATDGILWKIGRSRVVRRRLSTIRREIRSAVLVHVIRTDDAVVLEHRLHVLFHAVRDQGEWFRLTSADVAWLCSQQYMNADESSTIQQGNDVSQRLVYDEPWKWKVAIPALEYLKSRSLPETIPPQVPAIPRRLTGAEIEEDRRAAAQIIASVYRRR